MRARACPVALALYDCDVSQSVFAWLLQGLRDRLREDRGRYRNKRGVGGGGGGGRVNKRTNFLQY